jgi:hypothetical protein
MEVAIMFALSGSKYFQFVIVLILSFILQGCASVFYGPTQDVAIFTNPPAVSITVDSQPGATFASTAILNLERNEVHLIKANYDEGSTATVALKPKYGGPIKINCYLLLCISFDSPLGEFRERNSADITMVLP